jgi:hypothetical protein
MTRWRYGTIALLLVAVESPMAFADWDVQDSIAGIIIHISWPLQPEDVAVNENHEIHYVIDGESDMQLGEATTWLRRCIGPYCPSPQTRTFELNTFSNRGLLYCFPLGSQQ